jgi:hypothetical protein
MLFVRFFSEKNLVELVKCCCARELIKHGLFYV